MGRKSLIYLNMFYPYNSQGETFLASEIEYCKFENIDKFIFPIWARGKIKAELPGYKVINIQTKYNKMKKLLNVLFTFFSPLLYQEIKVLRKSHRISFHNLKTLISFLTDGIYLSKILAKYIKGNIKANSEIVFYSYWLHLDAFIAAFVGRLLKNKYTIKTISRCHRFDLYEYAAAGGYIPARKYILNGLNYVYPISNDAKQYLIENYNLSFEKSIVSRLGTFDNGVNISPKRNVLKIISCSWMRKVKRLDLICKALELVDFDIEWTHIGSGEEESRIYRLISSINNPHVTFKLVGSLSNEEVISTYKDNDYNVFINVSASEGVPVSIMEAMSFGKIIIATDTGGTKEIVKNYENGYLLEVNFKIDSLVGVLKEIYEMDEIIYKKMCKNSRVIWEEMCNAEKNYIIFSKMLWNLFDNC